MKNWWIVFAHPLSSVTAEGSMMSGLKERPPEAKATHGQRCLVTGPQNLPDVRGN